LNTWQVGGYLELVDADTPDRLLNFSTSIVSADLKTGAAFYGIHRNRDGWDANDDGFTEMVDLKNTTFGTKVYY
ncbi:hypothetical protein, partial [Winogradskyella poriferorum]|uniref:hypothetical protein n=1 Tax=Winogradskyella poriferorum TaxID=307627 RepID=UPI003D65FADD